MSLGSELRQLEDEGIDLIEVLGQDRHLESPAQLQAVLERLRQGGANLYVELLQFLTQRRFPPAQAESLWQAIAKSRKKLEERLGRHVHFRVAALDYLYSRAGILKGVRLLDRTEFDALLSYVTMDEVTTVYNRRYFNESLAREVHRARRYGSTLSLLVVDLDNFKAVNDRYGHLEGDMALRQAGRLLRESTRQNDIVCRYGGDEFALILPESTSAEAAVLAERVRKALGRVVVRPSGAPGNGAGGLGGRSADSAREDEDFLVLSASVGGATFPTDCDESEELVRLADRHCLEAKQLGKDRIRMSGQGA